MIPIQTSRPSASRIALATLLCALPLPGASQDIPDTSVEAIRAYADGAEAYLATEWEEAIEHFRRAHELDPTFFTPVFMAYVNAGNAGNEPLADSLEVVLQANRDRLSDYYQGMFDAVALDRRGMRSTAIATLRDLVERYPGTKAAYNYALRVWRVDPREALRALEQLDPEREPIRGWYGWWSVRASALHAAGEIEAGVQNALAAQAAYPDRLGPVGWEINTRAALGQVDRVEEAMSRALTFPDAIAGVGWRNAGRELMAHGFEREGTVMLERAIAWFEREDTRTSRTAIAQRAQTLYLLGRYEEARDLYRRLDEEQPGSYAALTAAMSALAGDRATAEATLERARRGETSSTPVGQASDELIILAALGDAAGAKWALARYGLRLLWLHQDPTLRALLGHDAEFQSYLVGGSLDGGP